jgi:hypothetical protein
MPPKRPADSLGRPLIPAGRPLRAPDPRLPSGAASLAMPPKRPADSLGRPLIPAGRPLRAPDRAAVLGAASLAMPPKRPADSLGRPLIPAGGRLRASNARLPPRWRFLAEDPDEEEDPECRERREDEGAAARHADRKRPEVDERTESNRPEERDHAVVEARRARHVRHLRDCNGAPGSRFHKLQGVLWKCG